MSLSRRDAKPYLTLTCPSCRLKDPQLRYQHFLHDFPTADGLQWHLQEAQFAPDVIGGICDWWRLRQEDWRN